MGCVYIVSRSPASQPGMIDGEGLLEEAGVEAESAVLSSKGRKSIFSSMRSVYKLLDEWRSVCPDIPLLLSVDSDTARIVHAYFCDRGRGKCEEFSMGEKKIKRYVY